MNLHKVASEIFRFYIWKVNSKRKSPPLEICLFLYEKGYLTKTWIYLQIIEIDHIGFGNVKE